MECAFGHLKARFQCLLTCLDVGEHNIPEVVVACCVLYNIVKRKGEAFLPGWGTDAGHKGQAFEQPTTAASQQVHQAGVCIWKTLRERFYQGPQ